MSPPPEVSIVIVTYNALRSVQVCLDSIRAHTNKKKYELIIVDNASNAPTRDFLKSQSDIRLILNDENRLWAAGCNQGLAASNPRSHALMLLNPDIEILRKDWLDRLLYLLNKPRIGIVGTKYWPSRIGPTFGHIDGQCYMIRRSLFENLGPLDAERFPWNGSPILYTVQAWKLGWKFMVHPPIPKLMHHYKAQSRKELSSGIKNAPVDLRTLVNESGLTPKVYSGIRTRLRSRAFKWRAYPSMALRYPLDHWLRTQKDKQFQPEQDIQPTDLIHS